MSYMKQDKKHKQTVESGQYGLEIIFKYRQTTNVNVQVLRQPDFYIGLSLRRSKDLFFKPWPNGLES